MQGNRQMFCRHLCSVFAFDLITFYLLLAIFSSSSEIIRTNGITCQFCAMFLALVVAFLYKFREEFSLSQEDNEAEVFILLWKLFSRLITSHLCTDQFFFSNFYGK